MDDQLRYNLIALLELVAVVFVLIWAISFAVRSANRHMEGRTNPKSKPRVYVGGRLAPPGYTGSQSLNYVEPPVESDVPEISFRLDGTTPVQVIGIRKLDETKALLRIEYTRDGKSIIEEVDPARVSGRGEIDVGGGRKGVLDMGR